MTKKHPPLLSGDIPIIGHALKFRRDPTSLFHEGYEKFGKVFALKLFRTPVAVITGADFNKLFYTETDKSLNISEVYGFLRASFGEVLFTAPKEVYQRQRPVLQMIFSRDKMAKYVLGMHAEVQTWLNSLGESGEFNLTQQMQLLTQYVVGHAFLGGQFHKELGDDFWAAYSDISRALDPVIPPNWPLPKNLRRNRASKIIFARLAEVIEARRKQPERYDDLITLLLQTPLKNDVHLSDEEIIRLFMGLIFAGHETTAGQAAWLVTLLLQHPDYLKMVQDEINEHVPYGIPFTGQMLRNLEHTYWAIDETTRMKPSAPLQMRIAEEDIEIGGYTIPAGWLVMVNAANSHFLPEVWSVPEDFDPYRFAPGRAEGKNSFNIIGFGGGIHKCTGMNFAKNEMAVISSLLLQQFDLELVTKNPKSVTGVGAARPEPVWIRYQKKPMTSVMQNTCHHQTVVPPSLQPNETFKKYAEAEMAERDQLMDRVRRGEHRARKIDVPKN